MHRLKTVSVIAKSVMMPNILLATSGGLQIIRVEVMPASIRKSDNKRLQMSLFVGSFLSLRDLKNTIRNPQFIVSPMLRTT